MKIIINEIPSEGLQIRVLEEGRFESVKAVSPYEAILKVMKEGEDVFLSGTVKCNIELHCSRCLNPYTLGINSPLDIVLSPAKLVAQEGYYELQKNELDVSFYKDSTIDIDDIVNEQLYLNIPMKPLCSNDCKGICPECGTDLNKTQCSCHINKIDERFKILEKLIKKEE